jgi:hypothetical protein
MFLGISGVAGSGKDLFYSIFKEEMRHHSKSVERYAIADFLKKEVSDFTKQAYGIDAFSCKGTEKELIRPLLVFHGKLKREQTQGRHWVDRLQSIFDSRLSKDSPDISCITDIRYAKYKNDEVRWLKDELGGVLVHISQYTYHHRSHRPYIWRKPANEEEESQEPLLKEAADYKLQWEFKKGSQEEIEGYTRKKVIDFVKWLTSINEKTQLEIN